MDTRRLRAYLNSLSVPEQTDYAIRCGTTIGYLRKVLCVHPKLDGTICRLLDELSGGYIQRSELRPDIWPEGPPPPLPRLKRKKRRI